jgi:hypothetical protein
VSRKYGNVWKLCYLAKYGKNIQKKALLQITCFQFKLKRAVKTLHSLRYQEQQILTLMPRCHNSERGCTSTVRGSNSEKQIPEKNEITKAAMIGELSCQRGNVAVTFYYWQVTCTAPNCSSQEKNYNNSLYFSVMWQIHGSPMASDLWDTLYERHLISWWMISARNFLIFIHFAVGNFTSDVRFVFNSNTQRV